MTTKPQSSLLTKRRFLPYFLTQALGAFNDNVYKNILLILIAYASVDSLPLSANLLINIAAGLFILPFFLFSASAGVIADQYDKAMIMRRVKLAEIVIMSLAAIAFFYQSYSALLVLLFLMGTQSAFFGPAKYALLPQHLKSEELISGNALVETGTFLAILLGTLLAGFIADSHNAHYIAAGAVIFFAILGYLASLAIPSAPPTVKETTFKWQPIKQTRSTMAIARQDKTIFQCILGISWFWFLGACYLTQFPNYAKISLGGNAASVSFLLMLFSIGIAIGSMCCDRLSQHRIDPGIVPIGSLGITLFGSGLYFLAPATTVQTQSLMAFMTAPSLWPIFASLLLLGIAGGIFIVPLYALMQQRSKEDERAQIIAANNIWNAVFMVVSAISAIVFLSVLKLSIPQFFLILAAVNSLVVIYIYFQAPDFFWRFVVWMITHTMYRVKKQNLNNIPEQGGVLLVCNHVSYMDALLLAGSCPRPIRFLMDRDIYNLPLVKSFCKACKAIPVDANDRTSIRNAFSKVSEHLDDGDIVCVFPEGQLTFDGEIAPFMRGIDLIIKRSNVTVIPVALQGLWGSYFSREGGVALLKWPKRFWSQVTIVAGECLSSQEANSQLLYQQVTQLRGDRK
ncbi:MFS transporter [Photobacterium angustum]|uniref:MFS transporter n=1 Tax=Photobacterium angustum TaxID=661 RepID=A0A855SEH0_PHOAN|nr:MFS transporter [Photobacterium angustum]KJG33349.1 acyl-phosphate glycerol 3-phosphate acyltransferase [Photobacterium angustum]KJG41561.1 acyl-phosphate glycerol 3-phosphate acyltransferase [Photobacterium angustum]KJG49492.1 acyl-phosphate glycerol 3-phosphate acyltransferase [Photobacterium angustum]PSW89676.1 MFS transporter [Photobacterium angustum]PSX06930.1 MFS transporter [Photobacterium angustum]